jgi:purine-binding chemotaxis protein CheW
MTRLGEAPANSERELLTFFIGALIVGMDIREVREISADHGLTRVPHAPPDIRGITNLRGEIVTVLDLGVTLGVGPVLIGEGTRIVTLQADEPIGVLVDRLGDTVRISDREVEPPPANLSRSIGGLIRGVVRKPAGLVAIVDVERLLRRDWEGSAVSVPS